MLTVLSPMLKSVPVCSSPNSISFNAILSAFSIGHKTLPEKSKLMIKTYTHHSRHLRYKSISISKSLNWKFRSLLYCDLTELVDHFSILTCHTRRPANASLWNCVGFVSSVTSFGYSAHLSEASRILGYKLINVHVINGRRSEYSTLNVQNIWCL